MQAVAITRVKLVDGTDAIKLVSPYHPAFPARAKELGGKWSSKSTAWFFDTRDEARVRGVVQEIFGVDPLDPASNTDVVTVRVRPTRGMLAQSDLWLFGRRVAARFSRDACVTLGEGVVLVEGTFPRSGGSARYPALASFDLSIVLEVRDVPRVLAEREREKRPGVIEIIENAPASNTVPTAYEQILALARQLTREQRERVAQAILELQ